MRRWGFVITTFYTVLLLTVAAGWSMWTAIPEQARPLSESIVLSVW